MIKIFVLYILRTGLSFYKLISLKKQNFVFISYQGKQYSCNPKAIYNFLDLHYQGLTFIWVINNKSEEIPSSNGNRLICVKRNSLKYFKYVITSKYVITNIQLSTFIPKKRKSIWINTWHGGGAFKKVEYPVVDLYSKISKNLQIEQTNYYISSSKKFSEVMSASTGIPKEKFLEIGMPRNDIFFKDEVEKETIRNEIYRFYGLNSNCYIVLFAPTYRGQKAASSKDFDFELDTQKIKEAFSKKTNKNVVLLIRAHHAVKGNIGSVEGVIDGTTYPDMQDLLVACDSLITDYSSSIWDFALTHKPGFLFVPDLIDYKTNRGLYTSISEWPFDFAETNEHLVELINQYDKEASYKKIDNYLSKMGCFDKGVATKLLLETLGINCEQKRN